MSKRVNTALMPKYRFPEFALSKDWDEKKLGSVTYPVSKKNATGKKYPIYSINNKDGFLPQEEQFDGVDSSSRGYDISLYKIVGEKTFAYNPARINVGSIGYSGTLQDIIISSLYVCFKTSEDIDDCFFQHFLSTHSFNRQVSNNTEGGIRNYLFYENFSNINFSFPNIREQQKIADCLFSIDDLITAEDKKLFALRSHKKGLMQKLFPMEGETLPKWRFPEFVDDEEWNIYSLSNICLNLDTKRIPITEKNRKKGVTPYYGASGIVDYVEGFIFDEYLLCVSEDGANLVTRTYPIAFSISGKTWVNNHAHPIVLYEYQPTRNASHPRKFLMNFQGICVTDGYQVYHTIEKEREDLKIAGCWAHARRRFDEAVKALPKASQKNALAYLALKQIQAIYREENKLCDMPPKERLEHRQLTVKPLVDAYFSWIKQNEGKVSAKSKTHNGLTYSMNQEKYLKVFLDDGEVPMDNNSAEQSIRSFCVGKNYVLNQVMCCNSLAH